MYGGLSPPVLCCRTDNGGEFDAESDTQLKQQRIRHECSLPYRPQTNARAERFHRTLAEGMRSLMLMSGLPDVFWAFCLAALGYLYARSPTPDGGPSPRERRFDRVYDISRRQPFGSACFFLEETSLPKFEPRGQLGVVLRYGRLESYVVLDYEHYVQSKGEARIVKTRDVRFMPELRFPFLKLREQHPDSMHWLARLFELVPDDLGPTADASGKCTLCGLRATNCEVSCTACLSRNRRAKHDQSPGCLQARCFGHASLDEFDNSSLLPSGGPSPPPPPHAPQDRDVDVDDVSLLPMMGPMTGRVMAVTIVTMLFLQTVSGLCQHILDISAPSTPDEQRGLVRERSHQTTPSLLPSDARAHKYVTLPQEERGGIHPHELPEPNSDVVDTSPPPGSHHRMVKVLPPALSFVQSHLTKRRHQVNMRLLHLPWVLAVCLALSQRILNRGIFCMIVLQRIKLSRVRSTIWHRMMFWTWHLWMNGMLFAQRTLPSAEMLGAKMLISIKD